jgi:ElaB/YqjD/DUF883 family membrane-anchored ribosome-binding protein
MGDFHAKAPRDTARETEIFMDLSNAEAVLSSMTATDAQKKEAKKLQKSAQKSAEACYFRENAPVVAWARASLWTTPHLFPFIETGAIAPQVGAAAAAAGRAAGNYFLKYHPWELLHVRIARTSYRTTAIYYILPSRSRIVANPIVRARGAHAASLQVFLSQGLFKLLIVATMRLVKESPGGADRLFRLHTLMQVHPYWTSGARVVTSASGGLTDTNNGLRSGHDYLSLALHMMRALSADILPDPAILSSVVSLFSTAFFMYTIAHGDSTWEEVRSLKAKAEGFIAKFQKTLGKAAVRQRSKNKAAVGRAGAGSDDDGEDEVQLNT